MKQYGQTWGFKTSYAGLKLNTREKRNGGFPIAMPGRGLYKIAKVSKDESNCCYDLEVQGFMCEVMKNKTAVSTSRAMLLLRARQGSPRTALSPPPCPTRARRWTTQP